MQSQPENSDTKSPGRKGPQLAAPVARALSVGLACTLAMGLLIWLKLRMVSDVPRSAYADPAAQAPMPQPKPQPAPAPDAAGSAAVLPAP